MSVRRLSVSVCLFHCHVCVCADARSFGFEDDATQQALKKLLDEDQQVRFILVLSQSVRAALTKAPARMYMPVD